MSPSECKALMFDFSQQLIEINKFTKTGIKKTLKKHGDFSISLVSYMYTNNIWSLIIYAGYISKAFDIIIFIRILLFVKIPSCVLDL